MSHYSAAAVILIAAGCLFLFHSFLTGRKICREVLPELQLRWNMLVSLMAFFIVAYILVAYTLLSRPSYPLPLLTGSIFLAGSLFVYLVIMLSRETLRRLHRREREVEESADRILRQNEMLEGEILQREKMGDLIAQAKEEWESTFDTINDAITIHDMDYNILRANRAAHDLFDMDGQSPERRKCFQLFHGTDRAPSHCPSCSVYETSAPRISEVYEPHMKKHLNIKALPRFDDDGTMIGIVHIVRDITERKKVEEKGRQMQERLAESRKMETVGRLAGGIAHDFNNILSAIIGYSEMSIGKLPENDQVRQYLNIIRDSGKRGAALTGQLLAYSRRQVLHMEEIDLKDVVRSMEEMLCCALGERNTLELLFGAPLPIIVGDRGQIEQVLIELAENARDAMPDGGTMGVETGGADLEENLTEGNEEVPAGRYARIRITDTGRGMDAETMERAVEPFFTTTEGGERSGLGLSTAYGIIGQHNGYLTVTSVRGKGTTVTLWFPEA